MPRERKVASDYDELGLRFDLDHFPGAGWDSLGLRFDLDGEHSGYDDLGLWFTVPYERYYLVPTDTGLLLAGTRGRPHYRYRMYRSNLSGEIIEELPGIQGATISLSNFRDHTWELSLPMRETGALNVFGDWVKVVVELADPDTEGGWQSFPCGLYRFKSPKGTKRRIPGAHSWDLVGRSAEAFLLESSAYQGYTVPAGTGVLAEARSILIATFGVSSERIVFPPSDVILTTATYFDPAQDTSSVRWLRIINTLLAAGGFIALYTDNEGRLLTKKIEEREDREANVRYGSEVLAERHIVDDIPYEYDDERFANRIVVRDEDVNKTPPIVAVAERRARLPSPASPGVVYVVDPASRGSIENYGAVIEPDPVLLKNIASQVEAELIAKARLAAAAGFNLKLSLSTVPDPRRGPRESYELDLRSDDGEVAFDGKFSVTGWSLSLDLSAQQHELSRQESI